MSAFKDLTGKNFNNFTVLKFLYTKPKYGAFYLVKCKCGNEIVKKGSLISRKDKPQISCRQCATRNMTVHGMSNTKEFFAWRGILSRCNTPTDEAYPDYGGRGISVCDRWLEFNNFFEDMGFAPSKKHSIDRIDNNGNYYKDNCRWTIKKVQNRNTRRNRMLQYGGQKKCIAEWAEELELPYMVLFSRINNGWDLKRAFTTPYKKKK